jgi:hypothetical protein
MSLARVELKKAVVTIEEDGGLLFVNKHGEEEGTLRLASVDPPDTWRITKLTWTQLVLAMGEWLVWVDGDSRKVIRRVRARGKVADVVVEGVKLVARLEDGLTQAFDAATGEAKVAAPVTAICARGDIVITGDKAGRVRIQKNETDLATLSAGESVIGVHITKKELAVAATARVLVRAPKPWTTPRPIALRAPSSSFAADDAYAFAGTMTGSVDVYDLENGKSVMSYALSSDAHPRARESPSRCARTDVDRRGKPSVRRVLGDAKSRTHAHAYGRRLDRRLELRRLPSHGIAIHHPRVFLAGWRRERLGEGGGRNHQYPGEKAEVSEH